MSVKPVSKNGRPHWRVRVVRKDRGIDQTRFLDRKTHSKRQAQAVERQMIAEIDDLTEGGATEPQLQQQASAKPKPSPMFADFAQRYIAVLDPSLNDYGNKVQILEGHLVPFFENRRLDEIGAELIEQYKSSRRKARGPGATSRRSEQRLESAKTKRRKDGPLSRKTINNHLTVLRHLLGRAEEWGELLRVPTIRLEKLPEVDLPALGESEVEQALAQAGEWHGLLLFAFRTGLREGELREVRWGDLDLERGRLRVRRQIRRNRTTGEEEISPLKSKRPRTVPLAWDLEAVLVARRGRPEELVFPDADGGHLSAAAIYRAFCQIGEAAELGQGLHPHLARHTFATIAAMNGVPLHVLQKWLGHSDIRVTRRYLGEDPAAGAEFIERVAPQRGLRVVEGGVEAAEEGAEDEDLLKEGEKGGTKGGTKPDDEEKSGS